MRIVTFLLLQSLLLVVCSRLSRGQSVRSGEELQIYGFPTQVGTVAMRTIRDQNGRTSKVIYYSLSGLKCFDSFLTTLDNWLDEITNYFLDRQTSGFQEGFNNKIKVLKRRCYGITNISHLFQRIWLDLEGFKLFGS